MYVYKQAFEEQEITFSILFDIGAIRTCLAHGDYYYSTGMEQSKVYQFASARYKRYKKLMTFHNHLGIVSNRLWMKQGNPVNVLFVRKRLMNN